MSQPDVKIVLVGGAVADIIVAGLPKVAEPGQAAYPAEGIQLHVGGHPTNISRDLVKLGVPPRNIYLQAAIGNDIFGQFIQAELQKFAINLHLQRIEQVETSKVVILVVKGEQRRNHFAPGASHHLDVETVIDLLQDVKPAIFYAGALGGQLNDQIDRVLQEAKQLGCTTFLDTPLRARTRTRNVLKYTDIIHLNDDEVAQYAGTTDINVASELLMKHGVHIAFITFGQEGALARMRSGGLRQKAFTVEMIDPTGPGDAFCSGILYALYKRLETKRELALQHLSLTDVGEMMLFGQAVGAVCVTGVGTTTAISLDAVSQLLKEQADDIRSSTRTIFP
jgi:sugar/nucleoside kinase (ribokinase family)